MPKKKETLGVLCDTSFLIRLNNPLEPLHANARGYLKYLLAEGHWLYVSTIALAEYAVRDQIENLPMRYFRVVPFNIDHAQRAGEFTNIVLKNRNRLPDDITDRTLIPNDSKLFAQADTVEKITYFLTADKKCESVFNILADEETIQFKLLSLHQSYHESFGILDLETGDE
jgi:predicted nucleic acid-binding protein